MDLYSILGQQLSVDEALPPETAPAAAALPVRAQPSGAAESSEQGRDRSDSQDSPSSGLTPNAQPSNAQPSSEDYALALRLLAEAKLSTLLATAVERVRYITNAGGVALALCENVALSENQSENLEDAMVCYASSGPAAPEVGARMYIRSGLTAESIRTRQTLRCDRASSDPRVNQESCKALGIESVMVLPLILDRNVVGMFELFGSKPSAFAERDATTLRASCPQVESALREAVAGGMPLGRIPWAEEAPPPLDAGDAGALLETSSVTLKLPVAFPIDAFRKSDALPGPEPEEQEVPAFLARLADEARPTGSRPWSQWFRPQW